MDDSLKRNFIQAGIILYDCTGRLVVLWVFYGWMVHHAASALSQNVSAECGPKSNKNQHFGRPDTAPRGPFISREVVFILDFYFSLYLNVYFQLISFWISFLRIIYILARSITL